MLLQTIIHLALFQSLSHTLGIGDHILPIAQRIERQDRLILSLVAEHLFDEISRLIGSLRVERLLISAPQDALHEFLTL